MSNFECLDRCPECEGSGSLWEELKGAKILQTTACWRCYGLRRVWRRMTKEEVMAALESDSAAA